MSGATDVARSPDGFIAQRFPDGVFTGGHWFLSYLDEDKRLTVRVLDDDEVAGWPRLTSPVSDLTDEQLHHLINRCWEPRSSDMHDSELDCLHELRQLLAGNDLEAVRAARRLRWCANCPHGRAIHPDDGACVDSQCRCSGFELDEDGQA